jgi:hypothetical protein
MSALTGEACADLTAESFKITTTAPGTLLPGSSTFSLTNAELTATGTVSGSSDTFTVTGSAQASVSVPNAPGVANLTAAVSFGTDGIVAGVSIPDLADLSSSLSGSAEVYISSATITDFNPSDYGLGNGAFPATIPLQAGVNIAYSYSVSSLPSNVSSALGSLGVTIPSGTTILAVAQVFSSGLSASLDVHFGTGPGGAQLFSNNGSAFYLDDVTLGITVGDTSGSGSSVSLSGAGYLTVPQMWNGGSPSTAELTLTASIDLDTASPVLTIGLQNWTGAFGIPNLLVGNLTGSARSPRAGRTSARSASA